ncbi:MAG: alpha/beta hydrolase [candidate division Zixibacteria bacterium]
MPHVDTQEVSIYYETKGRGSTIVFLHGFTLDRRMWGTQVEYFSKRFRTLVYDSRGHGKSGCPESGYSRADRVRDLAALVEKLRLAPFHIVGLSMGGATALGYAIDHPESLLSLTLADTAAAGFQPPPKYKDMRERVESMTIADIKRVWKRNALFYYARKNPQLRDELAEMMDGHCGNLWTDPQRGTYKDRDDVVLSSKIKIPTLIFIGEKDKFFLPLAKKLHQNIENSEMDIVSEVGHMVNMEDSNRFNMRLEQFLDRVEENR